MPKYLSIAVIITIIDQASKIVIDHFLYLGQSIKLAPFFNLTLVYNHGAAFGFLAEQGGWQRWFFLVLAVAVTIFIFTWLRRLSDQEKLTALALSLILGGALGNIIDRAVYGFVIDFLDFYLADYHWPAFNIADSAIVIGAGFIAVDMFKTSKK